MLCDNRLRLSNTIIIIMKYVFMRFSCIRWNLDKKKEKQ